MPKGFKRPLRVFLCHSSNDKPLVRELYRKLCAEDWIKPWLDEEELYPGQDWNLEIEKAVESSDVIIVCLSNNSVNKEGYVQRELRLVLDVALTKPEETIFVIPLRLEQCELPRRLRGWHYADYFPREGRERAIQRLLVSLRRRADSLGLKYETPGFKKTEPKKIEPVSPTSVESLGVDSKEQDDAIAWLEMLAAKHGAKPEELVTDPNARPENPPEWVKVEQTRRKPSAPIEIGAKPDRITLSNGMEFMRVPAGKFLMGSTQENKLAYDSEWPQHMVDLPYDYWMARFPVTNELYDAYVKAKGIKHPVDGWEKKKEHPVIRVSWNDAGAYCQWLNSLLKGELPAGLVLMLPTEAEWEKAARGTDGREWPWGNEFDKNKCNSREGSVGNTTPVGHYSPHGDSPFGCADMAGNVWEWTHSLYTPYPYVANDGREDERTSGSRVLRGGSFGSNERVARCASRNVNLITFIVDYIGFRVVVVSSLIL